MKVAKQLKEILREALSYLASEAMKAKKCRNNDRAEEMSIAFKILLKEYDKIRHHDKQ